MSLKEELNNDIVVSMKAGLRAVVTTLRGLKDEVQKLEKNTGAELDDSGFVRVVQTLIKRLNDSIKFAEQGKRDDLVLQYKAQRGTLSHYLPKQLTKEELEQKIEEIAGSMDPPNLGSIMKALRRDFDGQFEGKLAAQIAKDYL